MRRLSRRTLALGVSAAVIIPAGLGVRKLRAGGVFATGVFIELSRTRPPASAATIRTSGHSVPGLGQAIYRLDDDQRVSAPSLWRAQDANGRWWVLAEDRPTYEMFGARSRRDYADRAALQAGNDYAMQAGLAELHATPGTTYQIDGEVQAGAGVANLLNGAFIQATLMHPDDAALSLSSRSSWRNGRLLVVSGVEPGSQSSCHAGIRAGPVARHSSSPDRIDPQEGITHWSIEDMVIETRAWSREARAGKVAVQINGGTSDWSVRGVSAPDSAVMAGLVHADWVAVGPVVSADDRQSQNRAAYVSQPRRGWTTHPCRGLIEDCRGGRFTAPVVGTDTGSDGIRLSGCHDIIIRNCRIEATTYAGLRIVAGDLGFEFALPEQRVRAHKGLLIENFKVTDARGGHAIWIDMKADNVERAVEQRGYGQMLKTIPDTDIVIRGLEGVTRSGGGAGLRLNNMVGGRFEDCVLDGFGDGIQVDEGVRRVELVRPVTRNSQRHGGLVDHHRVRPSEISVQQPVAERSGVGGHGAHWFFGHCDECQLIGGLLGAPDDETAAWGVVLDRSGNRNAVIGEPRITVRPGGAMITRG